MQWHLNLLPLNIWPGADGVLLLYVVQRQQWRRRQRETSQLPGEDNLMLINTGVPINHSQSCHKHEGALLASL